jgi:glycosyltransferase involved in cell wall biosynthesis
MAKHIQLSVIVCCYRGVDTIEACLQSLLAQEVQGIQYEIVIVDDESMDGTEAKILEFLSAYSDLTNPSIQSVRKVNKGLSCARNFGIKLARAELVSFIDEDALADEYFVENVVQLFEKNSSINCIGGKVELLNRENWFARLLQSSIFSYYMNDQKSVIGTNMSFRKAFLEKFGGFQKQFTRRGDESAFFAKSEKELSILKSESVIVTHMQPPNAKAWLKTRYENGYFAAGIDQFMSSKSQKRYRKFGISISMIFIPLLLLFLSIVPFNSSIVYSLLIIYMFLIFQKFIKNKLLFSIVKEHYKNRNEKKGLIKVILILLLALTGYYYSYWGYIRGYKNFNGQEWSGDMDSQLKSH